MDNEDLDPSRLRDPLVLTRILKEKYAPLEKGNPPVADAKLAEKFHVSGSYLRRVLQRAVERSTVTLLVKVEPKVENYPDVLLSEPGWEIRSLFPDLKEVYVYRLPGIGDQDSNVVHNLLGCRAATFIDANWFSGGSHVSFGIGSGRTIRNVSRHLYHLHSRNPIQVDTLEIYSLTGLFGLYDVPHGIFGASEMALDADLLVGAFTASFAAEKVTVFPLFKKLFWPDRNMRDDTLRTTWIRASAAVDGHKKLPEKCVIGLGVFDKHRKLGVERAEQIGRDPTEAYFRLTEELKERSGRLAVREDGTSYTPVYDAMNALFISDPLPEFRSKWSDRDLQDLRDLVSHINNLTVTAWPSRLDDLLVEKDLVVVAGTSSKALGVYDLVRRGFPKSNAPQESNRVMPKRMTLIIDEEIAMRILKWEKARKGLPGPARRSQQIRRRVGRVAGGTHGEGGGRPRSDE